MDFGAILIPAAIVAGVALLSSLRVLYEYERGVVFRLGKLTRAKGPGLIFLVPFAIERMRKMDLRIVALDIAPQDTITKDNVSIKVNAVVYFRVADPAKAVVEIEGLLLRHQPARPDHTSERYRPIRARRDPGEAGADQRSRLPDHRPGDRSVGDRGHVRRGQGHRPPPRDEARHGQTGRGRAGNAAERSSRRPEKPRRPRSSPRPRRSSSTIQWPSSCGSCRPW